MLNYKCHKNDKSHTAAPRLQLPLALPQDGPVLPGGRRMVSEKRDVCHHGNWSSSERFQVKYAVSSLQAPVKPLSDWKSAQFQEDPGCASFFDPWAERRKAQQSCRLTDELWVQVSDLTSGFLCKSFIDPERNKVEEQHVQVEVPASFL